jgi:hypothetical protein
MRLFCSLVALDLAVRATSVASIVKANIKALKSVGGGTISNGGGYRVQHPTRNIAMGESSKAVAKIR